MRRTVDPIGPHSGVGPMMAAAAAALALLVLTGCGGPPDQVAVPGSTVSGSEPALKSSAAMRAARRAYDGAPPVIPHRSFGMACGSCHGGQGIEVPDVGYSPPSPHGVTAGMSAISRCRQCHVFRETEEIFAANAFVPLRQDLRRGRRLNEIAPPTIPHKTFMRENCAACHSGPAAREEIRTTHPERVRCRQCHVPVTTTESFPSAGP